MDRAFNFLSSPYSRLRRQAVLNIEKATPIRNNSENPRVRLHVGTDSTSIAYWLVSQNHSFWLKSAPHCVIFDHHSQPSSQQIVLRDILSIENKRYKYRR
jgi:hypothetical protein